MRQLRGVVTGSTPSLTLSGYSDVGFFVAQGDGVGFVQDVGPMATRAFPAILRHATTGCSWATSWRPRSTRAARSPTWAIRRASTRQDLIDSNGAPSFIANEVNLTLNSALAENVVGVGSVNFMPRTGTDFRFGDVVRRRPAVAGMDGRRERRKTSIFVGKFESVIGIEYRERKANRRFGITPSLIARYTTGTPLGIKFRSRFGDSDWLSSPAR